MNIDLKDSKTQYIIGAVIIVIALVFWIVFMTGSSSVGGDVLSEGEVDPIETIIGRQLLVSLEKMRSVKLDTGFVNDPVFQSLTDISVIIPDLPKGRRDPFAPIGTDANSAVSVSVTAKK